MIAYPINLLFTKVSGELSDGEVILLCFCFLINTGAYSLKKFFFLLPASRNNRISDSTRYSSWYDCLPERINFSWIQQIKILINQESCEHNPSVILGLRHEKLFKIWVNTFQILEQLFKHSWRGRRAVWREKCLKWLSWKLCIVFQRYSINPRLMNRNYERGVWFRSMVRRMAKAP